MKTPMTPQRRKDLLAALDSADEEGYIDGWLLGGEEDDLQLERDELRGLLDLHALLEEQYGLNDSQHETIEDLAAQLRSHLTSSGE